MRDLNSLRHNVLIWPTLLLLMAIGTMAQAQKRMTIQATAMGTSTQLGKIYNVNIIIEQFSTPADQKALIEAFKRSGQDGLVNVLEDMRPKGRVRFASGGVGNDVKYIIELPSDKGRRFRLVTDRYLSFDAEFITACQLISADRCREQFYTVRRETLECNEAKDEIRGPNGSTTNDFAGL